MSNTADDTPRFIFFAYHFNDVDHVIPIIYALLEAHIPPQAIRYILANPFADILPSRDPRLRFLASKGVAMEMPHTGQWLNRLLYTIKNLGFQGIGDKLICQIARKIYRRRIGQDPTQWPNHTAILTAMRQATPNTLFVFQHGDPPLELRAIAKEKTLKNVAIAHGVILYLEAVGGGELVARDNHPMHFFQQLIMPNELYATNHINQGVSRKTMVFLGCPRFFPEWMEIVQRIHPPPNWKRKGLRVLFLLEKGEVATQDGVVAVISMEGQAEALHHLDQTPGIDMAIKVNTRGIAGRQWKVIKKLKNSRVIAEQYATPALAAWSDVVVASCSSAVMDPIMRDKTMVMIPYIHPGHLVYTQYRTACLANSFAEFKSIMQALLIDPTHRTYTREEAQPFIREIVLAGGEPTGALQRYAQHFIDTARA